MYIGKVKKESSSFRNWNHGKCGYMKREGIRPGQSAEFHVISVLFSEICFFNVPNLLNSLKLSNEIPHYSRSICCRYFWSKLIAKLLFACSLSQQFYIFHLSHSVVSDELRMFLRNLPISNKAIFYIRAEMSSCVIAFDEIVENNVVSSCSN